MSGGPPTFAQGGFPGAFGLQALMQAYGAGQPQADDLPGAGPSGFAGTAALHPSLAGVGDLLTREGQFREQGRQAGADMGAAKAAAVGLRQGVGLNLDDEVAGLSRASGLPDWAPPLVAAPVGAARMGLDALGLTSGTARQDYADQRDYARGFHEAAFGQHPIANLAGQFTGGVALPVGATAQTAGMVGRVGAGMAAGAGYGAASGFGSGEGVEDRAMRAAAGGTIGGTVGGLVPAVAGMFAPAGRGAAPAMPAPTAISRSPAAMPARAAEDAGDVIRSGVVDRLGEPAVPAGDDMMRRFLSGIAEREASPSLSIAPYGRPAPGAIDDTMAAIRAGVLSPSKDTLPAIPPRPGAGPPFGPYGTPSPVSGDPMEAIRAGVMAGLPQAQARPAPGAFGLGVAAAGGVPLAAAGAQAAGFADRVVSAESGGNATAKNPRSSATGAGQFIDSTWLDMIGRYRPDLAGSLPRQQILGLRNDPQLSREMVDCYGQENGAKLKAAGLPDNDGTRYLSHVAGPAGARAVLSADPSTPVSQVLQPGQVAANPFMRSMTAGDLAGWAARKVGSGAPTMTMPGAPAGLARLGLLGPEAAAGPVPAVTAPPEGPGGGSYDQIEVLLKGLTSQKAAAKPEQAKAPAFPAIEAPGGRAMSLKEARQTFDPSRFYGVLPRGKRAR